MRRKVIISAPYMQGEIDRFRAIFNDENIQLHVPKVNERLGEADLLPIVGPGDDRTQGDQDDVQQRVPAAAVEARVAQLGEVVAGRQRRGGHRFPP